MKIVKTVTNCGRKVKFKEFHLAGCVIIELQENIVSSEPVEVSVKEQNIDAIPIQIKFKDQSILFPVKK